MSSPLPFTDSHTHFFDLRLPDIRYDYLAHGHPDHPWIGDYGAMRADRYWPDDYLMETRFHPVERVVHVENSQGSADPVAETRWLQTFTDRVGIPHGVIGHAELASDDLDAVLDGHLQFPIMRGIREQRYDPADDYLVSPAWQAGYAALGAHGLVFCWDPARSIADYPAGAALARKYPDTVLCVNGAGFPASGEAEYLASWRTALEELAAEPNVVLKLAAFGVFDNAWTFDTLRSLIRGAIDVFGVRRCFFGTNWPMERLWCSFPDLLDAYRSAISDLPESDQRALLTDNTRRIFRV